MLFKLGVTLSSVKRFLMVIHNVKLPDITHSAIILIGTHGQENLLVEESLLKALVTGFMFSRILTKKPASSLLQSHFDYMSQILRLLTKLEDWPG